MLLLLLCGSCLYVVSSSVPAFPWSRTDAARGSIGLGWPLLAQRYGSDGFLKKTFCVMQNADRKLQGTYFSYVVANVSQVKHALSYAQAKAVLPSQCFFSAAIGFRDFGFEPAAV